MFTNYQISNFYKHEFVVFITSQLKYNHWGLKMIICNEDRFKIYNALCENLNSRHLHFYVNDKIYDTFNITEFHITNANNLYMISDINIKTKKYLEQLNTIKVKFEYIIDKKFCDFKINL